MIFSSKRESILYVVNNYPQVGIINEKINSVDFMDKGGEYILQVKEIDKDKWELIDERK